MQLCKARFVSVLLALGYVIGECSPHLCKRELISSCAEQEIT